MKESEAAALWQGFVHGEGTGWQGQGRARARLLARLVGPRASRRSPPPATGRSRATSRRCSRSGSAPTATGATTRSSSARASCAPTTASSSAALLEVYGRAIDHCRPGREPRRARPADPRRASPRRATRASRRTRSATASARARTSRRTRTRPAAARSPSGMVLAIEPGLLLGGRRRPARRGQLPDHGRRGPRSSRRSPTGW